jgi:hypothetical protein
MATRERGQLLTRQPSIPGSRSRPLREQRGATAACELAHFVFGNASYELQQRGLVNRLFGGRLQRLMNHSWRMYPLGLLFDCFDTASELGLPAMTADASAGNLPTAAVLSLPILFAAGMTTMDTHTHQHNEGPPHSHPHIHQ